MPGFVRRLKINEGIHVEGDGRTIDIVIRSIYMVHDEKVTIFEVNGVKGLEYFVLTYSKSDMNSIPDMSVGIAEQSSRKKGKGRRNNTVNISFFAKEGYQAYRRMY